MTSGWLQLSCSRTLRAGDPGALYDLIMSGLQSAIMIATTDLVTVDSLE